MNKYPIVKVKTEMYREKTFWIVEAFKNEKEVFKTQYPTHKEAVSVSIALRWALNCDEV